MLSIALLHTMKVHTFIDNLVFLANPRYGIERWQYDQILRGKWTPPDKLEDGTFMFTMYLEIKPRNMFGFMTLLNTMNHSKLANRKPHFSCYITKAMKESDISDR